MLRNNVMKAARPVVANLRRRNISLEAMDGTPLDELVLGSTPALDPEDIVTLTADESTLDAGVLERVGETAQSDYSHGITMDMLVDQGAKSVLETLDKTRSLVIPAIGSVIDNVTNQIDANQNPSDSIAKFNLSELATDNMVAAAMAQYDGGVRDAIAPMPQLAQLTEDDLAGLLETGSVDLNERLLNQIATYPNSWLQNIISDVVRGSAPVDNDYRPIMLMTDRGERYYELTFRSLDPLVVAFIILRNLDENPPAGTSLSLAEWRERCSGLRKEIAVAYSLIIQNAANLVKSDRLFVSTLHTGVATPANVYQVFEPQYDRYLAEGGTPEALYAVNSPESPTVLNTVAAHLEAQAALVAHWDRFCQRFRLQTAARLSDAAKDSIRRDLNGLINDLNLDELGSTKPELWSAINAYLDDKQLTANNLYDVVVYLVANVIYGRYQAFHVIHHLDSVMEANPDVSPRVAAYLATVQYVTDWTLAQISK